MNELQQALSDGFAEHLTVGATKFQKAGYEPVILAIVSDSPPETGEFQVGERERVAVTIELPMATFDAAGIVTGDVLVSIDDSVSYRVKSAHRSTTRRTAILTANEV